MEAALILGGLVILAIPVAVLYLLVAVSGLKTRVSQLEKMLAARSDGASDQAARNAPDVSHEPHPAEKDVRPAVRPAASKPEDVRSKTAARTPAPEPTKPQPPRGIDHLGRAASWLSANWFYAVSALSLALAGLFLVQYGIENDLFPPVARVLAALGFGAALIGGGELIRRRYGDSADVATAYIPSVFSGAGLVSLFGGIAAARLLYDLIGVELAFAGMGAVGLLGVALGWFYGPLLAAVGVVGAFVAPLLVGSTVPATPWLFVYFGVVTAVGLGIDTVRRWAWVSVLSVSLGAIMGWLTVLGGGDDLVLGFQAHMIVLVALAVLIPARSVRPDHAGVLVSDWLREPSGPRPGFPTWLAFASVVVAAPSVLWTAEAGGAEPFWMAIVSLSILCAALVYWSSSALALQEAALFPFVALVAAVVIEGVQAGPGVTAFFQAYAITDEADNPRAGTALWGLGPGLTLIAAVRATVPGVRLAWGG
ncbi:MAG: DUF2339 domain-containing protein, partial [Ruegeria sp.]